MALPHEAGQLRPKDCKEGLYERSRARDSYKKQLEIFQIRIESDLQHNQPLDFDAKQEIRIRAKRLRETCLNDYRQSLAGLASTSHRRNYKDVFLGDHEASFEMHDPNVLEYELRLAEEMDAIIANINMLNPDLSNKSTLDWMASLARQKYSYDD